MTPAQKGLGAAGAITVAVVSVLLAAGQQSSSPVLPDAALVTEKCRSLEVVLFVPQAATAMMPLTWKDELAKLVKSDGIEKVKCAVGIVGRNPRPELSQRAKEWLDENK